MRRVRMYDKNHSDYLDKLFNVRIARNQTIFLQHMN